MATASCARSMRSLPACTARNEIARWYMREFDTSPRLWGGCYGKLALRSVGSPCGRSLPAHVRGRASRAWRRHKKNGLQSPIIVMSGPGIDDDGEEIEQWYLLDGRNRLDAMALVGIKFQFASVGKIVTNDVTLVGQKEDRFGREAGAYH